MSNSLSVKPNLVLSPFPHRTPTQIPLFNRTQLVHKSFLRGSLSVAKFGFKPDPETAEGVIKELVGQAENFLFTIADAAVSSSDTVTTTKQNSDWLSGITNVLETVLKVLKDGLSTLHVPYSYGFAIILLTVIVKAATFPLTKKQVESAMAMRSLTPQIKAIQQRYAGDQERIQLETARLYKLAGINPLAGCLPTLATIPVWIGLYRALSNVADEGLLTEGFFWIPSLAGPTTIAARQSGSGISWLFPFQDGHPPLGWHDTLAYLVLPVLLVVSQYISVQIMQASQNNDPNVKTSQALTNFLPLLIGYFSLSVPSGLSLYWFTNNILSTVQQVWLQKFGGAKNPMREFSDLIQKDQLEIQKPVSKLNSTKEEIRQGEKSTVEGVRRGERFKQLKEQEARKRREREEKRKAEEAATVKGNQLTSEEHKNERSGLEEQSGGAARFVDKKDGNLQSVTVQDTSNVKVVNGDQSSQELNKDENTISVFRTEDSVVSAKAEVDGRDEQQSYENLEKEAVEVWKSSVTTDNKRTEEDTHQTRRE